jgi:alpha-tubulin suppressor-like RCC1 family protein
LYYCGKREDDRTPSADIKPIIMSLNVQNCDLIGIVSNSHKVVNRDTVMLPMDNKLYVLNESQIFGTIYKTLNDFIFNEFHISYKTHDFLSESTDNMIEFIANTMNNIKDMTKPVIDPQLAISDQKLPTSDWIKSIKYFYVMDDTKGDNILFVTHENRVYGCGSNCLGSLGLGHNIPMREPQEIPELRDKKICNFVNGFEFIVCQSGDHMIYSWGLNDCGQLGIGSVDYLFNKPLNIKVNENNDLISAVSCGSRHTLVLTRNNQVYGWGSNKRGEVGSRGTTCEAITTPERVNFGGDYDIKNVYCFGDASFAVTSDGQVFSWGFNGNKHLGHQSDEENICRPKLLCNLLGITSVCSDIANTYFLSNDNHIYFCNKYITESKISLLATIDTLKLSTIELNVIHCNNHNNKNKEPVLAICRINSNKVYKLLRDKIEDTEYSDLFDYCMNEFEITLKTCDLITESTDNMIKFIDNTLNKIRDYSPLDQPIVG